MMAIRGWNCRMTGILPLITMMRIKRMNYLLNEETQMPYQFDVINYNTVRNTELIDLIESAGELFYTKDRAHTP